MKHDAKEKLIRSAIEVFAEKGYRDAKIANIVKGAGANIAAVNYHFGSKDQLFVEALRQAFADADEVYPSRGNLSESATAEEKIAAMARAVLIRSFDEGKAGNYNRIMSRTMHVPGSPVEMILREVEGFELKYLSTTLAEFLKTNSTQLVSWAIAIFLSLATMITKCPAGVRERLFTKEPKQSQINTMIESQLEVIFAALRSIPKEFPK
jgi:TetR/AcrR family transcriptional regulator, regulator of cefoperazone and chloramphenicol sensitivity